MKSKATELALEKQDGLAIVNEILIPALDQIGKDYETGKIFYLSLFNLQKQVKLLLMLLNKHLKQLNLLKVLF